MNYLNKLILVLGIAFSSLISSLTILLAEEPINQNKAYRDLRDEMSSKSPDKAVKLETKKASTIKVFPSIFPGKRMHHPQ